MHNPIPTNQTFLYDTQESCEEEIKKQYEIIKQAEQTIHLAEICLNRLNKIYPACKLPDKLNFTITITTTSEYLTKKKNSKYEDEVEIFKLKFIKRDGNKIYFEDQDFTREIIITIDEYNYIINFRSTYCYRYNWSESRRKYICENDCCTDYDMDWNHELKITCEE